MAYILALILCLISPYAIAQGNWQLVWSDEFNGNQIDSTKWEHEVNGQGGGNSELQYYTDRQANSWVENGFLNIRALQEQFTGPDGTRQYTSARLRTLNKGDWKYGRIVVRAKLPEGRGLWPAIWMLPTDWMYGGWASSGEIDIMEAVNLKTPNNGTVHGTLHYGGEWPRNVHTGDSFTPNQNPADSFHDYEIQWEEGEIRWYVDGQHFQTQTDWHSEKAPYPAPFDQRFHLLLNVAVGGNWPGNPNNSTRFPQTMQVDYVRVYQSGNGSENSTDEINIADQASNIVATVTSPQGGGNRNIEIIRDGQFGRQGSTDSRLQYDTYDRGTGSQQEYIGYEFTEEKTFSKVVFIEGKHFWDGGYFIDDLHVEVKNMNGVWEDVATDISPAYPYRNDREFFDKYTLSFEPTSGFGVRITGLAGGNVPFISVSELEVIVDTATNSDGTTSDNGDEVVVNEEERNLEAEASEIIATVMSPRGGGNRNIETIRDGQTASIGSNSSALQYDTFDFGRGSHEEYIGYTYDAKYNFTEVIFTEGRHFHDGGWFQSDLHVEVQRQPGGSWERVPVAISPAYPHRNNGQSYETYTLSLNQAEQGYGIRIQGLAGGNAPFISVSELAVKGFADNGNDNSSDSNGNDGSDSSGNNGGSDSDSSDNSSGDAAPSVVVPGRVEAEDYVAYND
ncbi:MAG: glycoside hydrolase family 16 protein, partial [Pseudomonadales bacterium]|nr:glycoside hydrolase family 16 protein [Pseudomonadales bacterium]